MIIFKKVVAGDAKYSTPNQANCVVFDAHNDSPYNMGISFGRDTGADNADYFTSAHSVLTGIGPKGNAPSINNVKWNGTIFVYTQSPQGGGTTNLSSVPASQITIIGYPAGYQPVGTTSLNRWNNIGNPVTTVGGAATSVQNDGNAAGTSILETSVPGTLSNQQASNDGIWNLSIIIAGALHQFFKTQTSGAVLQLGNGSDTVEVLGGLSADKGIYAGFPSFSDAQLNVQSLVTSQVAAHIASLGPSQTADILDITDATGNKFLSVDHAGAVSISTVLKLLVGSLTRISVFTASGVSTTPTFFNHGLGVIPDFVTGVVNGSAAGTYSCIVDYPSLTTTQCKLTGSASFNAVCLAIKL